MVAEEWKTHTCDFRDIPIQGCEELVLDHITDSGQDKNDDHVHLAWGLEGTLYRLLVCKHNPPHGLKSRLVTAIKRPDNETEPLRGLCYTLGTRLFLLQVGTRLR